MTQVESNRLAWRLATELAAGDTDEIPISAIRLRSLLEFDIPTTNRLWKAFDAIARKEKVR